jgi:hypothetical protein
VPFRAGEGQSADSSRFPGSRFASLPSFLLTVEGVTDTPAVVLLRVSAAPRSVALAGQPVNDYLYSTEHRLLWVRFSNEAKPRGLTIEF